MADDMLTVADVARTIGVTHATLYTYVTRGKFPKPDGHLGEKPWWKPETVAEWMATRRKPGRPRKDAT